MHADRRLRHLLPGGGARGRSRRRSLSVVTGLLSVMAVIGAFISVMVWPTSRLSALLALSAWMLLVLSAGLFVTGLPGAGQRLRRLIRSSFLVVTGGRRDDPSPVGRGRDDLFAAADYIPAAVGNHSSRGHVSGTDILFITSNGAGLGHLTRVLAITRRVPAAYRCSVLTMSRAYRTVAGQDVDVRYFPSAQASGMSPNDWNPLLTEYLEGLIRAVKPKVLVFDGTFVYRGVTRASRSTAVPLVWLQRGCWLPAVDAASTQRHRAADVADGVLIPGDAAVQETVDVGPGLEATHVGPISLLETADVLDRGAAVKELGLDPDKRHLLFNLGGGDVSDPASQVSMVHSVLAKLGGDWQVTLVRSPLSDDGHRLPEGFNVVRAYPVSRYTRAFDLTVAAAGYNAVQEAAALHIPSIFVPNGQTRTDDQVRRAAAACDAGWALMARNSDELVETIERVVKNPQILDGLRSALAALPLASGAEEAARHLVSTWIDETGNE